MYVSDNGVCYGNVTLIRELDKKSPLLSYLTFTIQLNFTQPKTQINYKLSTLNKYTEFSHRPKTDKINTRSVLLARYYLGDQNNTNQMGRACNTYRKQTHGFSGETRGKETICKT